MFIRGKEYRFNFIGRENFSGLCWWAFGLSIALLVTSIIVFAVSGINLGIEFTGGYILKVRVDRIPRVGEVNEILGRFSGEGLTNPIVQVSESERTIYIRMPYIEDDQLREKVIQGVKEGLVEKYQDPPEVAWFRQEEDGAWSLKVFMKDPTPADFVERLAREAPNGEIISESVETGSETVGEEGQEGQERNYVSLRMQLSEGANPEAVRDYMVNGLAASAYNINTLSEEQVGSEWGREVSRKALISLAIFLAVILVYISFRFEFKMAVPAIVALVHDTIITVGIYALFRLQVTPATAIAFLTILGYSLYDTIVVFDRIAENANLIDRTGRRTYREIVSDSLNQTLMRSLGTTLTTLLPIVTILIFGGTTLKDFAFALFVGVFLGAYSSIFIASPLLAFWKETEPKYAAVKAKAGKRDARAAVVKKGAPASPAAVRPEKPSPKKSPKARPAAAAGEEVEEGAKAPAASSVDGKKTLVISGGPGGKPAVKPGPKKKPTTRGPSSPSKKKKKKKKR